MAIQRIKASYQDPAGFVFVDPEAIYRLVTEKGRLDYIETRKKPLILNLIDKKFLLPEDRLAAAAISQLNHPVLKNAELVLQHPKLPFISYPFEWTFSALKQAALLHLAIQREALLDNISLVDASAYNIQFLSGSPIFIDHLSFRMYHEGEYWLGHQQFCLEFLVPLLLTAYCKLDFQAMYRGFASGIPLQYLIAALPWYRKLHFSLATHILLPAYFNKKNRISAEKQRREKKFPKSSYLYFLDALTRWISKLQYPTAQQTVWADYAQDNSYTAAMHNEKRAFVAEYIHLCQPARLLDMGCNAGEYAFLALEEGAELSVGIDSDHAALEKAFHKAYQEKLAFYPLYVDCLQMTATAGWGGCERPSLAQRLSADGLLCLALIHHLSLGRQIPLDAILDFCLTLAPSGIIEFVPKTDPMAQMLLRLKNAAGIVDYDYELFLHLLQQRARILKIKSLTGSDRKLIMYTRGA